MPTLGEPDEKFPDPEDADYVHGDWVEVFAGTPGRPLTSQRCQKVKKDGHRCKRWAVLGNRMCATHSGIHKLPNIDLYRTKMIEHARMELLRIAPKATNRLEKLIDDPDAPKSVQLKASTEVLDRIGVRGGVELDLGIKDDGKSPADILRERLEKLSARAVENHMSAQNESEKVDEIVLDAIVVEEESNITTLKASDDELHSGRTG